MKTLLIAIAVLIGGCAGVDSKQRYLDVKAAYVDAKVIYADSKHVVYEIEEEKARIKRDGFGEAQ